jgi:hypothetical protein
VNVGISPAGIVNSFAAGTGLITYTLPSGCFVTASVLVNPLPAAITGPAYACIGGGNVYTDGSPGGVWSSTGYSAYASIDPATGVVTGIANGMAVITYTLPTGCMRAKTVAVNPQPGLISGSPDVCAGAAVALTDSTTDGIWTSTSAATASVDAATGIVTGIAAGTAVISYNVTNRCGTAGVAKTITVDPLPDAGNIMGPPNVCINSSIVLSDAASGGVWSSSDAAIVVGVAGMVTGITAGNATVTYSVTNTCGRAIAQKTIAVIGLPDAGSVSGAAEVCAMATIVLSDNIAGGVWTAANGYAAVAAGAVTGIAAGVDTIYYAVSNLCGSATTSRIITVNTLPDAGNITGPASVCVGGSIIMASSVANGTWSGNNANAIVSGNMVTGNAAGTDTIMYTVGNMCGSVAARQAIRIVALPDAGMITGKDSVCVGDTVALGETVGGGDWSNRTVNVSVSATGTVKGLAAGIDFVYYTVTDAGCSAAAVLPFTVRPAGDCADNLPYATGCTGEGDLSIYPNPSEGTFTVNIFSPVDEEVQITIVNMVGQKLKRIVTATNKPLVIELVVPRGVYIISAISAHGKCKEKIVVE